MVLFRSLLLLVVVVIGWSSAADIQKPDDIMDFNQYALARHQEVRDKLENSRRVSGLSAITINSTLIDQAFARATNDCCGVFFFSFFLSCFFPLFSLFFSLFFLSFFFFFYNYCFLISQFRRLCKPLKESTPNGPKPLSNCASTSTINSILLIDCCLINILSLGSIMEMEPINTTLRAWPVEPIIVEAAVLWMILIVCLGSM